MGLPPQSKRALLVVLAAALALALVPGSISATGAAGDDPLDVARSYLDKSAGQLGVTPADVSELAETSTYRSEHNGVTHVNLNQRFRDLEVFGGHVTVNVASDGHVLLAAGRLVRDLAGSPSGTASVEPTAAVAAAAEALNLGEPSDLHVISEEGGAARETVVSEGGISEAPIPLRLGWQPTGAGLRLAWQLVIDAADSASLWNATIDAETGRLLASDDWTAKDNVSDLAARLAPVAARSHLREVGPAVVSPDPVPDGSSYRVLEIPKESPNDGPHTVVTQPADATASPFGWHDTNGAAGPEFLTTQGNNAHAYLDQDNNNAADFGGSPSGGPTLTFDFAADLTQHAQHYREAVATNLFYVNNTFHDVMYGYGFTEAAGNFQANNYGRGGTQGDYVRAEAADGGGTNNANFSTPVETPASAGTPRMQMYLWPGDQFGFQNQVVVDSVGTFNSSWSRFGGTPTVAGTAGEFVNAGNGCTAADYAGAAGKIAVATGGNAGCQNVDKARQAGAAGAIAIVIAAGSSPAVLSGSMTTAVPNIPVASITAADGTTIRNAIAAGPTTGMVRKHPSHPGIRDGDFENGIVIHEYGHGVSLRLTGGPAVNCLNGDEQGGEGWSDWYALTLTLNPAVDDPEGGRGMGPYALHQDTRADAGIRPRRYSRNWEIQPFSYDSIKTGAWLNGTSLAVPHGVGHGWASMLWDVMWELVDKHGFNPDVYGAWNSGGNNRALQYVTDGLKLQGCSPGFVAARNGVIAATQALGSEDTCTVWAAFARRGLGYSAVQGTTDRDDNSEAYDTNPDCKRGFSGIAPGPTLNVKKAGTNVPMKFSLPGDQGLDILIANNPYSRLVDCNTLQTVDPSSPHITPRPAPVPAESSRRVKLSYDASTDLYHFNWRTPEEWAGSCREFVLTRTDGVQHRAYFRFDASASFRVSGEVRDASGALVAGATVRLDGGAFPFVTTTDVNGAYAFEAVTKGTYTATASAGGCNDPHTQQVEVKNPTTLDFELPERTDPFGYKCRLVAEPFTEGTTIVPITGDDVAGNVTIPFPFTLYGQTSSQARICTNGWVEIGQTSGGCAFTNTAIPATARPNGAVYALWDDLFVDAAASIRTGLSGTAPDRQFVIEWRNVQFFGDTSKRVDVNVVLKENGEILTQYRNIADDGRERGNSATIGIENGGGTIALQFSRNEAVLGVQPAVTTIRYRPPQTYPVSGQVQNADGTPAANATVTFERPQFAVSTTTDAGGNYSFAGLPEGSYSASVTAGMCRGARQSVTVSGPTTVDFTLGDQTDAFGYSCSLVDLAYEEANTILPISGDDLRGVVGTIPLGFPFTFYGQTYTQAHVCTNGFLEFVGPGTGTCPFGNASLPDGDRPNAAIYPFWDDLIVDASASIRADTFGTAPNRRFVIEWRNVHFFGDSARRVDFNIVLHENGEIVTQYRNIAADGREQGNSATIGIENAAGNVALQFSSNQAVLGPAPLVTSIRYRPPA